MHLPFTRHYLRCTTAAERPSPILQMLSYRTMATTKAFSNCYSMRKRGSSDSEFTGPTEPSESTLGRGEAVSEQIYVLIATAVSTFSSVFIHKNLETSPSWSKPMRNLNMPQFRGRVCHSIGLTTSNLTSLQSLPNTCREPSRAQGASSPQFRRYRRSTQ